MSRRSFKKFTYRRGDTLQQTPQPQRFWWVNARNRTYRPTGRGSRLKGAFADLSRGFIRVFGKTKMTVLLGFTIAGYNLDRIRSFRSKQRALADKQAVRPKRRSGTWRDLGASAPAGVTSTPDSG